MSKGIVPYNSTVHKLEQDLFDGLQLPWILVSNLAPCHESYVETLNKKVPILYEMVTSHQDELSLSYSSVVNNQIL